eukprot:6411878-Amphidinium_carterae.1
MCRHTTIQRRAMKDVHSAHVGDSHNRCPCCGAKVVSIAGIDALLLSDYHFLCRDLLRLVVTFQPKMPPFAERGTRDTRLPEVPNHEIVLTLCGVLSLISQGIPLYLDMRNLHLLTSHESFNGAHSDHKIHAQSVCQ